MNENETTCPSGQVVFLLINSWFIYILGVKYVTTPFAPSVKLCSAHLYK